MSAGLLDAGKYAAFVWPAYGVSLAGFVWMVADSLLRARRWRRELRRREQAEARHTPTSGEA